MTPIAQTYPQLVAQLAGQPWPAADFLLVRRAYDLAASLFAGRMRGSGKPFVDHLVGTASGVLVDGAPAAIVAAALMHAAYDQGDFGDGPPGITRRHRATVRAQLGGDVEEIVAAYQEMGWGAGVARRLLATVDELAPPVRAALRVRVANEVDDALDGGLVLSGKATHPDAATAPAEMVFELADLVGGATLAAIAREVLLAPVPSIPPALLIGEVGSSMRWPLSARRRGAVRGSLRVLAGRVTRRVAPGLHQRLARIAGRVTRVS